MTSFFPGKLSLAISISHVKGILLIFAIAPIFTFVISLENACVIVVYYRHDYVSLGTDPH